MTDHQPGLPNPAVLMGEGMVHHYRVNPHHPEHYPNGVNGMTLIDLVEMLADWADSSGRTAGGTLAHSLQVGAKRFEIGGQLMEILVNTARHYGWLPPRCQTRRICSPRRATTNDPRPAQPHRCRTGKSGAGADPLGAGQPPGAQQPR